VTDAGQVGASVLVTMRAETADPTLESFARRLHVDPNLFDAEFGVVLLDPQRNLWCARMPAAAVPSGIPDPERDDIWIADDPSIEGFGLP